MNILYTITRCHPAIGGAEIHVRQIAHALSGRHSVSVVAHTDRQRVDPIRACTTGAVRTDVFEDGPVRVHFLGVGRAARVLLAPAARLYHYPTTKPLGYRLYASLFAGHLERYVRTHQIDLIHNVLVGTEYLSHLSCETARRCGIPFVITPLVHEGIWGDGPFFFRIYRQADAVIALLDVERALYIRGGVDAARIHTVGVSPVIASQADPAFFRKKYGLSGPVILFVGRQVESKGIPDLLAAAPRIWEHHPEATFVLIGPAEESSRLVYPSDSRLLNLGPVSDQEKADALSACDMLCLPSRSEIMPTVILEAWSFGKPVIGGDIPALRELIEGAGGGVVVEPKPETIARAILAFLDDKETGKRKGEAGRARVAERYTSECIADRLEKIYRALCLERTGP